jgi:hypothetical protein
MGAGWILSGAISTGGVSALAVRIICAKKTTTSSTVAVRMRSIGRTNTKEEQKR